MVVTVASVGMMKDAKHWDNPSEYNPDRFSRDSNLDAYQFQSFGHGPRNCIGKRFALLQTKIAVFRLVANYKLNPCQKTVDEIVKDPKTGQPKEGLWIKCQRRDDSKKDL